MAGTIWQDNLSPTFIDPGTLQYPLYGFLIDKLKSKHYKKQLLITLVLFHVTVAGIIIVFS